MDWGNNLIVTGEDGLQMVVIQLGKKERNGLVQQTKTKQSIDKKQSKVTKINKVKEIN